MSTWDGIMTHGLVGYLSRLVSFPEDQLRTVLCLLLAYPLAFLLKYINNQHVKHVYGIVFGLVFCTWCLGEWAWVHSFISSTIVYIMLRVLPIQYSYKVVFVFVMSYISGSHIYRMYTDYMGWTLDYTGSQMVVTLKLISLAFNYYDGHRKDTHRMTDEMKRRSIRVLPNLLEYYGFIYFFPTFLAGPPMEITDYLSYMNRSMFGNSNRTIPSTLVPTLVTLSKALLMLPMVFISNTMFSPYFLISPAFQALPMTEKIWRVHLHAFPARFKYYFAWYLTEGSCTACGLGYSGSVKSSTPGQPPIAKFDRYVNSHPTRIETASNMRDIINNWNMGVNDWLRNYVYLRVTPPGSKPSALATLATYGTSAFWHGFYPGYYIFFLLSGLITEIAKDMRRKIRPLFLLPDGKSGRQPFKMIYDVIGTLTTLWFSSIFGVSFIYLSAEATVGVLWREFYYLPPIIVVVVFVVVRFFVPTPRPPVTITPSIATKKST
eukprot:TRINITY_DN3152_c0_g2_i3.p1 TRINITY_DN3152_c0_g2~~TRINITY_DN3152_c0_g2_i3.p1  ORF type:complete len:490 (-),score=107.59 TRINITY_DN3152_c0_g2_i3:21-1490(-)